MKEPRSRDEIEDIAADLYQRLGQWVDGNDTFGDPFVQEMMDFLCDPFGTSEPDLEGGDDH